MTVSQTRVDFDDWLRPVDGIYDRGAFEYHLPDVLSLPLLQIHADALEVSGVTVAREATCYRIETPSGPAIIASLPWVTRGALLMNEELRSLPSGELDRTNADIVLWLKMLSRVSR